MMLQSVSSWRKHWFTAGGDVSEVGVGVTAENVKEQQWVQSALRWLWCTQTVKNCAATEKCGSWKQRETNGSFRSDRENLPTGSDPTRSPARHNTGSLHTNRFCVQAPREQIKSLFIDWLIWSIITDTNNKSKTSGHLKALRGSALRYRTELMLLYDPAVR